MPSAPSTVNNISADYARRQIQWSRIRDALEGQDEIKGNGQAYLKKPTGMTNDQYDAYKDRAQFFSVSERTLRGMSGLVFRHPAKFELPTRLEPLREAATTDGHSLEIMAENVVNELLSMGRYGMLVDFPAGNTSATSVPYFACYTAENITDWTTAYVDGMRKVIRIVLRDDFDDDDADNEAERRLELTINDDGNYEVRKWVANTGTGKDGTPAAFVMTKADVPTVGGKPLNTIPFVFINAYDLRPEVEKPPMLDLVDVNIGHYRNSADYEHALYLTAQPTPWVAGAITEKNKPTTIGSGAFWVLPENATAGMLEFSGVGIEAQRQAMEDKENRMAALGARMIHEGRQRNEASDTARMRGRSELSLLTNVVDMAQAGMERALRIAAEWVGSPADSVDVALNRDWVETRLDAQEFTALMKAWQAGAISHATLWENLQRGEIAPVDRTVEEEQDMIEAEAPDMTGVAPQAAPQPDGVPANPGEGGAPGAPPEEAAGTTGPRT